MKHYATGEPRHGAISGHEQPGAALVSIGFEFNLTISISGVDPE
jgi:hypothetical protein